MKMPLKIAPWIFHFVSVGITVTVCIYACQKLSFWFYPLSLLLIGNRYFALTLLGHEAAHGHLAKNTKLNDFIGRWLCHFPCLTSHTHYQGLHLRHHKLLGTERDLDRNLYEPHLPKFSIFVKTKFKELCTGKMLMDFIHYFNGLPFFLKARHVQRIKNDYFSFAVFWSIATILISLSESWSLFFFFWILPAVVWMPWMQFVNYFHHHFDDKSVALIEGHSRDIKLHFFLQELLFPVNLHLHRSHHMAPNLNFHDLSEFAKSNESTDFFSIIKNDLFAEKVHQP